MTSPSSYGLSNSTSQEQFLTINCIKQSQKDSTEENSSLSFSASKINNKISPKKDKINEPELGLNNSNYKETENSQVKIIDKANDNTNFTNCTTINYSRTPTYKIKNKNTDITEITKKCEIKTDTVISPEFPENKSIKDREILDSRVDKNLVHNTAKLKGHKNQENDDDEINKLSAGQNNTENKENINIVTSPSSSINNNNHNTSIVRTRAAKFLRNSGDQLRERKSFSPKIRPHSVTIASGIDINSINFSGRSSRNSSNHQENCTNSQISKMTSNVNPESSTTLDDAMSRIIRSSQERADSRDGLSPRRPVTTERSQTFRDTTTNSRAQAMRSILSVPTGLGLWKNF